MAKRNVGTMGSGDQTRYLRELEVKLEKAERSTGIMRKQYEETRVASLIKDETIERLQAEARKCASASKADSGQVEKLAARVQQLEAENAELEVIANDCDEHLQTSKQQVRVLVTKIARRDEKIEKLKAELENKQDEEKRAEFTQKDVPMANSTVLKLLENLRLQTTEMREMILDAQDKIITKKRRNFS